MLKQLKVIIILCCFAATLQAQTNTYRYKASLSNISQQWHSIPLPSTVFSKSQASLSDLRIYGFKGKDTIEVPYILEKNADQVIEKETPITIINQSNLIKTGSYYTLQLNHEAIINQIRLSFKESNFDWNVQLEGSNEQNTWFTILNNYRVLAIKNNSTDYQFTQLNFPDSKYKFYRILIRGNQTTTLLAAKILKIDTLKGIDKPILYQSYHLNNDLKNKESIIEVNLHNITPVSFIKLNVQDELDFYRAVKMEYATDSFSTNKGTQYHYALLYEGTISSLENPEFRFNSALTNHLRITIRNNDNKPLRLSSVELKGPIYELVARFENPDYTYALYYGNDKAEPPVYELKNFENKIPMSLTPLTISAAINNPTFAVKIEKPLFENKAWLWALMGLIISLLGYFCYKMLKN
jgi:hypothetical protein